VEDIRTQILDDGGFLWEGFDDALIGVSDVSRHGLSAVYDYDTFISILMRADGVTYEDAIDTFSFNFIGFYSERCPIFVWRPF